MAKTKDLDAQAPDEVDDGGYSYADQMASDGYWEKELKEAQALKDAGGGNPEPSVPPLSEKAVKELEPVPQEQPEEVK